MVLSPLHTIATAMPLVTATASPYAPSYSYGYAPSYSYGYAPSYSYGYAPSYSNAYAGLQLWLSLWHVCLCSELGIQAVGLSLMRANAFRVW